MPINPRTKGARNERLARDLFRDLGWSSERIPCSGAVHWLKGDITLSKGDIKLVAEVKSRGDEYKRIYGLLDKTKTKIVRLAYEENLVTLSYNFRDLGFEDKQEMLFDHTPKSQTVKKIIGMKALLKTADFLMVRNNHRPFIYIRYHGLTK